MMLPTEPYNIERPGIIFVVSLTLETAAYFAGLPDQSTITDRIIDSVMGGILVGVFDSPSLLVHA
jgi:uncharacterized membrane-anchored protein YitT (DUF2179 family)